MSSDENKPTTKPSTPTCSPPNAALSVAPMVDCTDRHFRFFARQITRHTLFYSEMIATRAVLGDNRERVLGFSPEEQPVALQLGGDDPRELAECARIAADYGYVEINLNVGCPSERVQQGRFGACLMAQPELVARCVSAMKSAVSLPVTVKHRIGIDDLDRYDDMTHFVRIVAEAGCDRFIVHARIALLGGLSARRKVGRSSEGAEAPCSQGAPTQEYLRYFKEAQGSERGWIGARSDRPILRRALSPKKNRTVPPLRYDDVYRLKRELPALAIHINGGITSLEQAAEQLRQVDGVMIGRAAYENPFMLAEADAYIFGDDRPAPTRRQVVEAMLPYIEQWAAHGLPPHHITRHMLGLYAHQRGCRRWRRKLSEGGSKAPLAVLRDALQDLPYDGESS